MEIRQFDEIPADYAKALDEAVTLADLRATVSRYELVAGDALDTVCAMDDEAFSDWRSALKKERRGKFMGEEAAERFGPILMPEAMLKVTVVASHFGVPWGLAYHRLSDTGRLTVVSGRAVLDINL